MCVCVCVCVCVFHLHASTLDSWVAGGHFFSYIYHNFLTILFFIPLIHTSMACLCWWWWWLGPTRAALSVHDGTSRRVWPRPGDA